MGSYENETWAGFGKICAWLAGIAAAGGALYWIGSEIYDSGRKRGEIKGQEETAKEWKAGLDETVNSHNKQVSKWIKEGKLIPEEACFRYSISNINGADVTGVIGCGFTLNYFSVAKKVELGNGRYSTTLSTENGDMRPSLAKKVKAQWETINLAP